MMKENRGAKNIKKMTREMMKEYSRVKRKIKSKKKLVASEMLIFNFHYIRNL